MKNTQRSVIEKKDLQARLNKIIGQLTGIKKMIEEDRYCIDILTQLSASEKAIQSLSALMLENHLNTCVVKDIKEDNLDTIDELIKIFKRFN